MKPVYKHLCGHVAGAGLNSNGPIRAKMKRGFVSRVFRFRCRSAYHKPCAKAELKISPFLKSFDRQSKLM